MPEVGSSTTTPGPIIICSSVYPTKVQPGDLLTVSVSVLDFFGVKKVQADFFHEHGFNLVNLSLVSGTIFRGVWQGQWTVHDTIIKQYMTSVTVVSRSGSPPQLTSSGKTPQHGIILIGVTENSSPSHTVKSPVIKPTSRC
ncbi:MAG: hypothetical protein NT038_05865 [Euryarchaeota archaeon]|nr:hypothetical protein [Euryarchaeota archaeon]